MDKTQELHIKKMKLQWWHDEMQRIHAGDSTHPLAKDLAVTLNQYGLPFSHLENLLAGIETYIHADYFGDFTLLQEYCAQISSSIWQCIALILTYADIKTPAVIHEFSIAYQISRFLFNLRADLRNGHCYFPLDELKQYQLDESSIVNNTDPVQIAAFIRMQCTRLDNLYTQTLETLPEQDRYAQRMLIILSKIDKTLMQKIDSRPNILQTKAALLPINNGWIAWRVNRSEHKKYKKYLKINA